MIMYGNARGILSSLFLQTGVPISSYQNGALVADFEQWFFRKHCVRTGGAQFLYAVR